MPGRRLGQHFLHDRRVLAGILAAVAPTPDDFILEIGPGRGVLTRELVRSGAGVAAVELDGDLAEQLRQAIPGAEIIRADALTVDPCEIVPRDNSRSGYKLAGNIPYYITGALLRHYLEARCRPAVAVLMVQWEVACRLTARPGAMSLLALGVQLHAEPEIVRRVSPSSFRPPPNVDSAVIKLTVRDAPAVPVQDLDTFFRIARAGFSARRKQMVNSLSHSLKLPKDTAVDLLEEARIPPSARAEALSLDDWSRLTAAYLAGSAPAPIPAGALP